MHGGAFVWRSEDNLGPESLVDCCWMNWANWPVDFCGFSCHCLPLAIWDSVCSTFCEWVLGIHSKFFMLILQPPVNILNQLTFPNQQDITSRNRGFGNKAYLWVGMWSSQICFPFYTVMKSLPKLSRELLSWLGAAHATACWSAESLHGFVTGLFIPGESSCSSSHFWPPVCLCWDIGKIVCSSSSQ